MKRCNIFVELKNSTKTKSLTDDDEIKITVRDRNKSIISILSLRYLSDKIELKKIYNKGENYGNE